MNEKYKQIVLTWEGFWYTKSEVDDSIQHRRISPASYRAGQYVGFIDGFAVAIVMSVLLFCLLLLGCTTPQPITRLPSIDIHGVIRTSLRDYHEVLTLNNQPEIQSKLRLMGESFQGVRITSEISDAEVGGFDKTNWRAWFMQGLYAGETLEEFNARMANGKNK